MLTSRSVAVVCMIFGAAFFAWSCGKMTRALTDSSQCVERFKDKWEEVEEFMHANDIPEHLSAKIQSFYMLKFPLSRVYDDDAILEAYACLCVCVYAARRARASKQAPTPTHARTHPPTHPQDLPDGLRKEVVLELFADVVGSVPLFMSRCDRLWTEHSCLSQCFVDTQH